MVEHGFGKTENFKKFLGELIKKKPEGNSQKSFFDFLKGLRSKYENTGNQIKIAHIERDCSYMVLEDNSQWSLTHTFEPRQIYWSRGETIIVYHERDRGKLFNIRNLDTEEDVAWKFHGFLEE